MTRRALAILNSKRNDACEVALAALREYTQDWWAEVLESDPEELEEDEEPATPDAGPYDAFWTSKWCHDSRTGRGS